MTAEMRTWMANGLRGAVLAAFIVHFTLTGVYVLYENPLHRALAPLEDSYTAKYFSQNWALFAPNPLSANLSLMVRPLTAAETAAVKRDRVPATGWYDLTRALWERKQQMPFSYEQSLAHFHVITIQQYLDGDPAGFASLYECQEGAAADCADAKTARAWSRERATLYLWRLGSEFVNAHFAASAYPAMAIKIHEALPVSWRDRGSGRRQTRDILVGVYATDPTRSPMSAPVAAVSP